MMFDTLLAIALILGLLAFILTIIQVCALRKMLAIQQLTINAIFSLFQELSSHCPYGGDHHAS